MDPNQVDLKAEIEKRLCRLRQHDKALIFKVRKTTGDKNAFNRSQLHYYRTSGFPQRDLNKVALGYWLRDDMDELTQKSVYKGIDPKLLNALGMGFESIEYVCNLKVGKNFPTSFDAEISIIYKNPIVSPIFGTSVLKIRTVSDFSSLKKTDFSPSYEIKGKGIELIEGHPLISHLLTKRNAKTFSSLAEVLLRFRVYARYNGEERAITTKRFVKDMFYLDGRDPIDLAGLKITRPTGKLTLRMNLPPEIFIKHKFPSIKLLACEESSFDLDYVDYEKTTCMLVGDITCMTKAFASYEWISKHPPLVGINYSLSYNQKEMRQCIS